MGFFDLFKRKKKKKQKSTKPTTQPALSSSSFSLWKPFKRLFSGKKSLDSNLLDKIETLLVTADIDLETAEKLVKSLKKKADQGVDVDKAIAILQKETLSMLKAVHTTEDPAITSGEPYVILVVGVNGVGKTTTIGKLAYLYTQEGKEVAIGAGDTFRAAAVDQIKVWGERLQVPVISQGMHKAPAAVAYDAVEQAIAQHKDILIIDTAGRLHNREGLMQELAKVKRAIQKKLPNAPHEVLLVLDGSTGQNAWQQAKLFNEALGVTSLAVTKLDGVAKGGVVVGIAANLGIPIRYIGLGERAEDLQRFDAQRFTDHLFGQRDDRE